MSDPRKIAYDVLVKCSSAEQYSNIALDAAIKRSDLTDTAQGLHPLREWGSAFRFG